MRDTLIVGDTLDFVTRVPDYPASAGYTLKYRLVPRTSGTPITLTASASGDDHRVTIAAATTANWTAGEYSAFAWVEGAGGVYYTVDPQVQDENGNTSLLVRLLPDPRTVAAYDGRSPARKALDECNAALSGWAGSSGHVLEYEIAGRRMRYADKADVLAMRSRLKAEVWNEDNSAGMAAGLGNRRNVAVRWGRA